MNVNVKIRKKVEKPMRPHPFSRQKFAISLALISMLEFASLRKLFETCNLIELAIEN